MLSTAFLDLFWAEMLNEALWIMCAQYYFMFSVLPVILSSKCCHGSTTSFHICCHCTIFVIACVTQGLVE